MPNDLKEKNCGHNVRVHRKDGSSVEGDCIADSMMVNLGTSDGLHVKWPVGQAPGYMEAFIVETDIQTIDDLGPAKHGYL